MLASSKSAELLYEPGELALARQTSGAVTSSAQSGAALRRGSAPARRPTPTTVTFLNGRDGDISIRWTHVLCAKLCPARLFTGGLTLFANRRRPNQIGERYAHETSRSS